VFGPQTRFPYLPQAAYIPPDALPEHYARMLATVGCQRAVLVQPSIYGTDNRCLVAALTSGAGAFRGVAVVAEDVPGAEIEALHRAGARGVRINVAAGTAGLGLEQAPRLATRLQPLGWHLEFHVQIGRTPEFEPRIAGLPVPCVIDHFGQVRADGGRAAPDFQALLRLARLSHVWLKLTGPYRISRQWPRYADVASLAQALAAAAPDRCLWGTDWPHTGAAYVPNDGDLGDALADWLPDPALRRKILVDNPARLYGFA
jgi:predicted TIM-barrel fold metal-dependent hydrolase